MNIWFLALQADSLPTELSGKPVLWLAYLRSDIEFFGETLFFQYQHFKCFHLCDI